MAQWGDVLRVGQGCENAILTLNIYFFALTFFHFFYWATRAFSQATSGPASWLVHLGVGRVVIISPINEGLGFHNFWE